MLKVVFFGTPTFVDYIVKSLRDNFELLKEVRSPKELNEEEIKKLNADIFVVASFGKIFTKEFINLPKYASLNIHPSLLPKFRGPSPIQSQILESVKESAITFIKMDEQVDHGPILKTLPFEILDNDTFESAAERAFKIAADAIPKILNEYVQGKIKPIEQDHSKSSYTKHLTREDGFLNPETLEIGNLKLEIERAVRAYYPWPGVYTKFKVHPFGKLRTKFKVVKLLPEDKIQVEGKKPMSYKDFVNGYPNGSAFLKKLRIF